jgi:hypothetical protein
MKTEGFYLCGLSRWLDVCRLNSNKSDVIYMVLFGLIAIWFIVLLDRQANQSRESNFSLPLVVLGVEIIFGFIISLIGYG